jgi:hypothetical protein
MNRRSWCLVAGVVSSLATAWGLVECQHGALPGIAASPEVVAAMRAGQTYGPCQDNGVACSGMALCATAPPPLGGCVSPSAACGSCSGSNHKVCKNLTETSCSEFVERDKCCSTSQRCETHGATPPQTCSCVGGGVPRLIGTHINCK